MSTKGLYGNFGGRYVAEILRKPVLELEEAFERWKDDSGFKAEFDRYADEFIGRPTPLMHAENLSRQIGGARIYVKMEGLAHTGAHKINNALGQALLARRMGKTRIIAETGAGQHGVATAAVCAKLGFDCTVYMGTVDIRRQRPNVFWMELFGARVVPVASGAQTLKDAVNEALRDWSANFTDTHYLIGSALGPHPYPAMVKEYQSVIGRETALQMSERDLNVEALIACVGGGSNSIGFFAPFIESSEPRLIGVEAAGLGLETGAHASRMTGPGGREGIIQGYKSLFLTDDNGQVLSTHSISAGLDYPGIGPELAHLGKAGRIEFASATDTEALEAVKAFARYEGVIFALESAHAGAEAIKLAAKLPKDKALIVNMSGRGDKDLFISAGALAGPSWKEFLAREAEGEAGDE
ncbi:tryptophan synthase subunit beta [Marispirochaeta aestuarii]|uniref:tryptophan synthase subunit beta n=1 Tax=Marispirochaeta aestuarii TaxID=1963862 RepID=UPI002ABD3142|nr:tryptophan synthase subunit beta [Marispirochaeta aestuarii]